MKRLSRIYKTTLRYESLLLGFLLSVVITGWAGPPSDPPQAGGISPCEAVLYETIETLGICEIDYASCEDEVISCEDNFSICSNELSTCETDLTSCIESTYLFPATGQVSCWAGGDLIPCADTEQDGDIQAGGTLSYTDNGDGTITDNNTGLMWEKKINDDNSVHNFTAKKSWNTALTGFLDTLNYSCNGDGPIPCLTDEDCGIGSVCGFAGYTDWRIPNMKELWSIVNYEKYRPAVSEEFNYGPCVSGPCTFETCSCTPMMEDFWSSTTLQSDSSTGGYAWSVNFTEGHTSAWGKGAVLYVRAVRGGLND